MAFSTIDIDTSWQDLGIVTEIWTAYNKRAAACGLSALSEPTEDTTCFDFIIACQAGIESMYSYWADPSVSLTGQASLPVVFSSLSEMMTAAGLTAEGYWRRIALDGTAPATWTTYDAAGWSYGQITNGDLAGPWVFADLMSALSVMTRRVIDPESSSESSASALVMRDYPDDAVPPFPVISPDAVSASSTSYGQNYSTASARRENDADDFTESASFQIASYSAPPNTTASVKTASLVALASCPDGDLGLGFTDGETSVTWSLSASASTTFTGVSFAVSLWSGLTATLEAWASFPAPGTDHASAATVYLSEAWVLDYAFADGI